MNDLGSPEVLSSLALVPEQLPQYVRAVSGAALRFCRGYAVYLRGERAVLVGYPSAASCPAGPASTQGSKAPGPGASPLGKFILDPAGLDEAIAEISAWPGLSRLTVLAPFRPGGAPERAGSTPVPGLEGKEAGDRYSVLDLPYFNGQGEPAGQKLRNMLRRAARELTVRREEPGTAWDKGCAALVERVLAERRLDPGTRRIYARLRDYLENAPGAALFTARSRVRPSAGGSVPAREVQGKVGKGGKWGESGSSGLGELDELAGLAGPGGLGRPAGSDPAGELQGFCIGDFSALDTAFYMFAFRRPDAVPGCADLLLAALVREAEKLGHLRVNLGLGINGGIEFFKRKWGARPFLPYLETTWELHPKHRGILDRLFGRG